MLSNDYLLAKFGVDTAENEPVEVRGKIQFIIHSPLYLLRLADAGFSDLKIWHLLIISMIMSEWGPQAWRPPLVLAVYLPERWETRGFNFIFQMHQGREDLFAF